MDALSLSHLTSVDATVTVNFHRLDHPPFPCTHKITALFNLKQVSETFYPWYICMSHISHHTLVDLQKTKWIGLKKFA